jgi:hypothetical protein
VRDRLKASQVYTSRLLLIYTLFDRFYLRVHPTHYLPDPKSFIQDICQINPCHVENDGEAEGGQEEEIDGDQSSGCRARRRRLEAS